MRSKGVWLRGYGVGAQILGELLQRDISSEHDTTASCHRSLDQCDDDRVPSVVTITSRSRMSIRKKTRVTGVTDFRVPLPHNLDLFLTPPVSDCKFVAASFLEPYKQVDGT